MKKLKDGKVLLYNEDGCLVLSLNKIAMLQFAADDWSRVGIAQHFELSVRTVEKHFDDVRKFLGKKSFAAALVELCRKKIIK